MIIQPLSFANLKQALAEGWQIANATRGVSIIYSLVFVLGGVVIIGGLLAKGMTPFVIAAAGAFMLIGPPILAGFFGIAAAYEAGEKVKPAAIISGFRNAAGALWVVALVCCLLFMIFVTDVAILYAYMIGGTPVWLVDLIPAAANIVKFIQWAGVSGFIVAFLLFCFSAFSVPLLCERRAALVQSIVLSVRVVFGSLVIALVWALFISSAIIGSILLLPLLPLTLPWLAYASRSLYRQALPTS